MLEELNIKNFALIDELHLDFGEGLNILTGETGAGKSIVIGAVSAVLGEHLSGEYIRSGEKKAQVEGSFKISSNKAVKTILSEMGIEEEEELILSREITSSRKSSYRVSGKMVTLSTLKKVSQGLVDLHGQHEHQSLLIVDNHLHLLDALGGKRLGDLREKVTSQFYILEDLKKRCQRLQADEEESLRRLDLGRFQIEEIEKANLVVGEDKELEERIKVLQNAERLLQLSNQSCDLLSGEERESSLRDNLSIVLGKLKEIILFDKSLEPVLKSLEDAFYQVEDATRDLKGYKDSLDFSPRELEEASVRLDLINSLKRKYGKTISEVLAFKEKLKKEVQSISQRDEEKGVVLKEIERVSLSLSKKAKELSLKRQEIAKGLEEKVKDELSNLGMKKCQFRVSITQKEKEFGLVVDGRSLNLEPRGIDKVEFLISPNPGEDLKPLAKIASGGEMSRIMLALKSILSKVDPVPSLIFDEIDTGIGGEAARMMGRTLSSLSSSHQVICVTHLPAIASFADHHYYVEKEVVGGRTKIRLRHLDKRARVRELARMLRGEGITETTLRDAEELLGSARGHRDSP